MNDKRQSIIEAVGYAGLPENSPIRVSTNLLDTVNGGTVMLEATVDSGTENGLHDPDLLRRLSEASAHLPDLQAHGIRAGKAWSFADGEQQRGHILIIHYSTSSAHSAFLLRTNNE